MRRLAILACLALAACDSGTFKESDHSTQAFDIVVYKPVENPINYNVSMLDVGVQEPIATALPLQFENTVPVAPQPVEQIPQVRDNAPLPPRIIHPPVVDTNEYNYPEDQDEIDRQDGINWAKRMQILDFQVCSGARSLAYAKGCVGQAQRNRQEYDERGY
jgi:hypothetical protein